MTELNSEINLETLLQFLLETEIFAHLTTSEITEMATILEIQRHAKGEVIFSEGDIGDAWYVVYQGRLTVSKHIPFKDDSRVASIARGATFGEMAILTSTPRSATIVAREDVVLMRFARRKFERLLEEGKLGAYKVVLGMGRILSERHRFVTQQVADLQRQVDEFYDDAEDDNTDMFERTDLFTK